MPLYSIGNVFGIVMLRGGFQSHCSEASLKAQIAWLPLCRYMNLYLCLEQRVMELFFENGFQRGFLSVQVSAYQERTTCYYF